MTVDSLPLSIQLSQANTHDSRRVIPLIENLETRKPEELYGDMAYDTFIVRWYLGTKRIKARIPKRSKKKRSRGRPPSFDKESYKKNRGMVERFFSWIKNYRKVSVRFERHAVTFLGLVHIACFLITWKVLK